MVLLENKKLYVNYCNFKGLTLALERAVQRPAPQLSLKQQIPNSLSCFVVLCRHRWKEAASRGRRFRRCGPEANDVSAAQ